MAVFGIYKLVYVLFVTSATTGFVPNFKSPYNERTLDEDRFCHPLGKKGDTITIRNTSEIVRSTGAYRTWVSPCRFVFKVRKGDGLIAVIQNMYLRHEGNQCVDYIQFKRKDRQTRLLCGQIHRRRGVISTNLDYSGDLAVTGGNQTDVYGEYDSEGEIETMIHLNPRPLLDNERLELTIVYTPYKDCRKIKLNREDYREVQVSGNASICMLKEYFCDGYQNCISPLCRDEEGCPIPEDVMSISTGTKATIGAVTSMLVGFVIFVLGLWVCKRHKILCWSSDCAGPSPHDDRLQRGEREADDTANPSVAVSPMLEVAVLPSVLDKDLPPSYDSLFPEQSNPSTT